MPGFTRGLSTALVSAPGPDVRFSPDTNRQQQSRGGSAALLVLPPAAARTWVVKIRFQELSGNSERPCDHSFRHRPDRSVIRACACARGAWAACRGPVPSSRARRRDSSPHLRPVRGQGPSRDPRVQHREGGALPLDPGKHGAILGLRAHVSGLGRQTALAGAGLAGRSP